MKKVDLTQGNVVKVIIILALPIIGSSLFQFTYNFIDMLFVGRLGSNAVASVGTASFLLNIGYAINALVAVGTGITVSHSIGEKDTKKVTDYINSGFRINFYLALAYAIAIIVMGNPFIQFLNLKNLEVEKQAYRYLVVSAPIMFITFYNLLYTRILSSFGNNKIALKINAVGLILNILLDPFFIYVLGLGVVGAAYATLIGNFVVFVLFYRTSQDIFEVSWIGPVEKNKLKTVGKLGMPMFTQRILFTVINILLAKIIAQFGRDGIAAQKIGLQIESIALMILGGLNGAIASFVGQNFGARQFERIKKGYGVALTMGSIYAGLLSLVFIFKPEPLVRLFISEESTIAIATAYLFYTGIALVFAAFEIISNGAFTGLGLPKIPAVISMTFTTLRLPLALILISWFGISGVWMSLAITSVLKGIAALIMYKLKVDLETFKE